MEMGAVADLFDRNGEGLIDWQEFIAALRPDWQERKPATDADKIHDEVKRLVMLCTCRQKFRVFQVGEGKYRVSLINLCFILFLFIFFMESCFQNIKNVDVLMKILLKFI
jgi:Growth-Arrest-Specific Protein 2 Domain